MYPAFRSTKSASGFCLLMVALLLLPFLLFWAGLPSREEAYKSIPVRFGVPGREVEAIYNDPNNPDVLFLGSSLMMTSVYPKPLEDALSSHLGRPAHVTVLGMDWQGVDLQYFILRDFLQHHHPGLIVYNPPSPGLIANYPHPEAYRWFRYGDFSGDFTGLPVSDKLEIYGHMVLGGPRQLLSRIRPNVLADNETTSEAFDEFLKKHRDAGYRDTAFIADNSIPSSDQMAFLLPPDSPVITTARKPPAVYPQHFFDKILELVKEHHCKLVLMHIPTDDEFGSNTIKELDWFRGGRSPYELIGTPAGSLYSDMSKERFLHYYADGHMNKNGSKLFTAAITPSLIKAYDEFEPTAETQAKF